LAELLQTDSSVISSGSKDTHLIPLLKITACMKKVLVKLLFPA
jgi:hypothetical protein